MREKFLSKFYGMKNAIALRACGVDPQLEAGDHLLEVLGVIIIAVVILIFFRQKIADLFNNAMGQTTNKVTNLFTDVN